MKKLFNLGLALLALSALAASPSSLHLGKTLKAVQSSQQGEIVLWPADFPREALPKPGKTEPKPKLLTEMLYETPLKAGVSARSAFSHVFALSALKKLTYYSYSKKKEVPLFKEAKFLSIDSKSLKPAAESIPARPLGSTLKATLSLKDNVLGSGRYALTVTPFGSSGFHVALVNDRSIYFYGFHLFSKGELRYDFFIQPNKRNLEVYALARSQYYKKQILGRNLHLDQIFEKRMDVFQKWITMKMLN